MGIIDESTKQSKDNSDKKINQQSPKKYIRCPECGEAILMVPSLDEMIASIDDHLTSHRKQPHNDLTVAHLKKPALQLDLAQQALLKASDIMNPSQKHSLGFRDLPV
jgi:hypothetical protein